MHEETLRLRTAKLGPDHLDTLHSRNNLGQAYQAAGRTDEAIAMHEETLRLRTAKLGPDHPDTLISRNNLAKAYQAAGRTAEAIAMHEETLKLRTAKLGPDHPARSSAATTSPWPTRPRAVRPRRSRSGRRCSPWRGRRSGRCIGTRSSSRIAWLPPGIARALGRRPPAATRAGRRAAEDVAR